VNLKRFLAPDFVFSLGIFTLFLSGLPVLQAFGAVRLETLMRTAQACRLARRFGTRRRG